MKLVLIVCCWVLCLINTTQATQLEPSVIQIDLTGGDTENITITVIGDEIIYFTGHEILSDGEGINITYPLVINPLETPSFNMTIKVAINIVPGNYTIILKYYYEEIPDVSSGGNGRSSPGFTPVVPDDEPDDVDEKLVPEPDDEEEDEKPLVIPSLALGRPDKSWLYFSLLLFVIFGLVSIFTVLYIIISKKKGKKAEKPRRKQT